MTADLGFSKRAADAGCYQRKTALGNRKKMKTQNKAEGWQQIQPNGTPQVGVGQNSSMASAIIGSFVKLHRTLCFTFAAVAVLLAVSQAEAAPQPGQCTWGAKYLFDQTSPPPHVNWSGNASSWLWNAAAAGWEARTSPWSVMPGSIICWTGGSDGFGHVGYVQQVNWSTGQIYIKEMNWAVSGGWNWRWLSLSNLNRQGRTSTYWFAGYIQPRWSPSCKFPRP